MGEPRGSYETLITPSATIHRSVRCAECGIEPIVGKRFKADDENFDLRGRCIETWRVVIVQGDRVRVNQECINLDEDTDQHVTKKTGDLGRVVGIETNVGAV